MEKTNKKAEISQVAHSFFDNLTQSSEETPDEIKPIEPVEIKVVEKAIEKKAVDKEVTAKKAAQENKTTEQLKIVVSSEKMLSPTEIKKLRQPKETKTKRVSIVLNPSVYNQLATNAGIKNESINAYITNAIYDILLKDNNLIKKN